MNNAITLNQLLAQQPGKKSWIQSFVKRGFEYLRLYFFQKKSHRARIITAKRLLKLFKKEEFKNQPGLFFGYIRKIDPFVFEELLLIVFQARGYKVVQNKRYTGDGGIDGIVILPNKQRYAVQAKRYQNHINAEHVKQFGHDLKKKGCHGGFFIHSGKSGEAVYQHLSRNIILISGTYLHELITAV